MSFAVPELAFNYLMLNTSEFSVRDFMSCLDPAGVCLQQLMWQLHSSAAKEVSNGTIQEKATRVASLEALLNSKDKELMQAQSQIKQFNNNSIPTSNINMSLTLNTKPSTRIHMQH